MLEMPQSSRLGCFTSSLQNAGIYYDLIFRFILLKLSFLSIV